MNRTTNGFANDITNEIEALRAAAANAQGGLRVLQEMELGWVAGGDGGPNWDNSAPGP
jgi:hypothetical protein